MEAVSVPESSPASSLVAIRAKIEAAARSAGREDVPELVAVSKFQPLEKLRALYDQGQRVFGENYVQELIEKKKAFEAAGISDVDFQFIGHLQTNKVKLLLPFVDTIHSVDSFRLLDEIASRATALRKSVRVYFQINVDQEVSKGGFSEADLPALAQHFTDCSKARSTSLIPMGLMCIPDPEKDPRGAFLRMRAWSSRWKEPLGGGLSMGMSDDFPLAIECGSTVVRIGSALFGTRRTV